MSTAREELLARLASLAGRTLLGVVDCPDGCVELVLSGTEDYGRNLVSLYPEGHVLVGFVLDPEEYVEACGFHPEVEA